MYNVPNTPTIDCSTPKAPKVRGCWIFEPGNADQDSIVKEVSHLFRVAFTYSCLISSSRFFLLNDWSRASWYWRREAYDWWCPRITISKISKKRIGHDLWLPCIERASIRSLYPSSSLFLDAQPIERRIRLKAGGWKDWRLSLLMSLEFSYPQKRFLILRLDVCFSCAHCCCLCSCAAIYFIFFFLFSHHVFSYDRPEYFYIHGQAWLVAPYFFISALSFRE